MSSRVSVQVTSKEDEDKCIAVYCSGCGGFLGGEKVVDGIAFYYCRKCKIKAIVLGGSYTSLTMDKVEAMIDI